MSEPPITFVLHKTKNGWIVTDDDGWMNRSDVANCFVFETMAALCEHLLRETKSESSAKSVVKKSPK